MIHAFEDVLLPTKEAYYYPKKYTLKVVTPEKEEIKVETLVHNTELMSKSISPGDYVKSLNCSTYKRIDFGLSFLYVIDNTDLYNRLKSDCEKGNNQLRLKQ